MEIGEMEETYLKYGPFLSKKECVTTSSILNGEVGLIVDPIRTQTQMESLKKIEQFLKDEFGLKDKDISKPMHPDVYNGTMFKIISEEKELMCEMRIVFLKSLGPVVPAEHKVMYSCRISIDYPTNWNIHQYKEFCDEIKRGIRALGMKRFIKRGERCTDPMIYELHDDIDIESFKIFVQEIQVLSSDFTLKYPINTLLW